MPRDKPKPAIGADAARRATRSAFQGSLVTALILLINLAVHPDLTPEQILIISTVALPIFSYLQNALEEAGAVPTMLKGATPPPTDALDARKFDALAAALGSQHDDIERLEGALRDLRADLAPRHPDADPRIFTGQEAPWPGAHTSTTSGPSPFRG